MNINMFNSLLSLATEIRCSCKTLFQSFLNTDVYALLQKYFGLNWREIQNENLTFYKNTIDNNIIDWENLVGEDEDVDEPMAIEEDNGFRIYAIFSYQIINY
ncbi:hypothetical protein ABEB36_014880 [Hypothenemus hampei]|uniref:Uncharacterized protein n=1 Tax=Hypothenemus hampei TaxID=57062 RepID=A0ABD1E163_HYPHA